MAGRVNAFVHCLSLVTMTLQSHGNRKWAGHLAHQPRGVLSASSHSGSRCSYGQLNPTLLPSKQDNSSDVQSN